MYACNNLCVVICMYVYNVYIVHLSKPLKMLLSFETLGYKGPIYSM